MKNKFLSKVSLVISILIIAAFIRFSAGDILASNPAVCPNGGEWVKDENSPYSYSAPDGNKIAEVCIKGGQDQAIFNSDGNNGCWQVTGINSQSAQAVKIGEGPVCKDISHVSFKISGSIVNPTPTPTPTPIASPTSTPKPHEKWNICHHTGSQTNPYVKITVSSRAEGGHFDANGNPLHGGDKLISQGENCPAPSPKPSASPNVVLSAPCTNCGGTTVSVVNNNNNTNNSTNNNNVNNTNTSEVKVPTVLPETGAGAVAAGGVLGVGPLGYYLARVKRGKLIKEVQEESLAETAFGLVNSRIALKQDA